MDAFTLDYLNKVQLGQIKDLTPDAKMLVYLNPKIVNQLAGMLTGLLDHAIIDKLEGNK